MWTSGAVDMWITVAVQTPLPGPGLSLTPPGDHPATGSACSGDPAPPGHTVPVSGTEPPMAKTGQGVGRCAQAPGWPAPTATSRPGRLVLDNPQAQPAAGALRETATGPSWRGYLGGWC